MSQTLTAVEINCSTGEIVERALTQEEISEIENNVAATNARKAQEEAEAQAKAELKASAKAKLIAGQPLTAEEADVLVI
jgi:FMN-dependent NADH-azoreductase